MSIVKKMGIPICGLALGLAALGNLLGSYGQPIRYTCGIISFIILLLFTIKAISDFGSIKKEFENPAVSGVLPTYTMALMLLCTYVKPFIGGSTARIIWIAALVLQFIIIFWFAKAHLLKFNIKKIFPSLFIVAVGYVAASVTCPAMEMKPLGQALFYLGFIFYLVALPVVLYRVFKIKEIPEPAQPLMAIFSAPASLCLAGYLSAFDEKNIIIVYILLAFCVVSYVCVLAAMFKLLWLKFYPSYSAFTFPLVISAVALKSAAGFLGVGGFPVIADIAVLIAVLIVLYVLVKYIVFLTAKAA